MPAGRVAQVRPERIGCSARSRLGARYLLVPRVAELQQRGLRILRALQRRQPERYQNGNFTINELAASYIAYNLFPTITSDGGGRTRPFSLPRIPRR